MVQVCVINYSVLDLIRIYYYLSMKKILFILSRDEDSILTELVQWEQQDC